MGNQQLRKGEYKMNNLERRIKERFPNENIEVLHYTRMKEPAEVKCLNCGSVYQLKSAENFIRASKKCICSKCVNNGSGGRLTLEQFQEKINKKYPNERLKALNYTLKDKPASIQCLKCGNIYTLNNADSFLSPDKNRVCKICFPNKREQMNNTIIKFKDFIKSQPFELLTDLDNTRIYAHTLIQCKCKYCGKINEKTLYDYLKGHGCTCQCTNTLLTNEEYQKELGDEYTLLSEYKGREHSVMIKHNLCGFCYKTNARHYTCPKCRGSKGEKAIAFLLQEASIEFIQEYKIKINEHDLRFDFYLPKYDIFIEYQGEQHFKAKPYFGGEKGLKRQQQYDNYKRDWCKINNHNLLEINYDEDIKTKLFNYLLKFNDHPEME
jgi:hypothetical protein